MIFLKNFVIVSNQITQSLQRMRERTDTPITVGLIQKSMGSVGSWMDNFTRDHGLTQGKVKG